MKQLQRKFLMAILVIVMLGSVAVLPVLADTNPPVLMFDVQGNSHVPSEKVMGVISNSKIGMPLDPGLVQLDMKAIHDLGYFADVRATTERLFNGMKLIFIVVENPVLKEIKISGLTKIKNTEIEALFSQKPGDVFNTTIFQEDLGKALKYCQEKKGFFVRPTSNNDAAISPDGVVQLNLAELKYGKTKIQGLLKTKEQVVRRELKFKEGDLINITDLQTNLMSLMRTRLFDNIEPKFEVSDAQDSLDLVLEVKEAQTGSFSFGGSYSEQTHQLGAILGYSESNLMGLGQSLSLDINLAESGKNISMSFNEPWLDEHNTSFGLSVWNTDNTMDSTINTWDNSNPTQILPMHFLRTGLSLNLGRPLGLYTRANLGLSFEKNNIDHIGGNPTTPPSLTGAPYEFWDNSAQFSLVNNKLRYADSTFVNGGHLLQGTYSISGKFLGGYFDYQKATADWKLFKALTPDLVFGNRLGVAYQTGDYPDYDQLYLGGMFKLRGYSDRMFDDELSRSLIGDYYWLNNTELRYRIPNNKSLEFVLFADAGQMYDNNNTSTFKYDYGIGVRFIISFLGVLRLDQAWNADNKSKLVFSMNELF